MDARERTSNVAVDADIEPDSSSSSQSKKSSNGGSNSNNQEPFFKPFTKKNWDAIIDEFEKDEEKDQDVNELFKQIYQSSNEDVRRAMNKSFQESGGTVLSTNWENVAHKRVEPKPPSSNDDKQTDQ